MPDADSDTQDSETFDDDLDSQDAEIVDDVEFWTIGNLPFESAADSVSFDGREPIGLTFTDAASGWTITDLTFTNLTDVASVAIRTPSYRRVLEDGSTRITEDNNTRITEGD